MIPAGFAGVEAQLWLWLVAMIRPGACFLAAPVFGANFVPVQLRLIVALAVGIPALGTTGFVLPQEGLASIAGVVLVASEVLVGLAIGFSVQIGFAAASVAGEIIGNAMGLGFAAMVDPATGQQNPALSQLLSIVGTFLFLAMNGHLMLAAIVVESYRALPPGDAWLSAESIRHLAYFGSVLFAAGVSVALPVGFSIVLVQIIMGVLSRTAPALNLFAVGFPAALLAGLVLLAIASPIIGEGLVAAMQMGLEENPAGSRSGTDMSEQDKSQKTEQPTAKRLTDAAEKGDVLASRELGTALIVVVGGAWIALAGPAMVGALETMVRDALSFGFQDVRHFDPAGAALRLLAIIAIPMIALFGVTLFAAIGAPALLGSLGFRSTALGFKASKLNPVSGLKRIFGLQGLVELGKSLLKVLLIGSIGAWVLMSELPALIGLGSVDTRAAIYSVGGTLVFAVLLMAGALALIAMVDVPVQKLQRTRRLRMSKQEVKDEHKQQEGSPEVKGQIRARQREVAKRSVKKAMAEATVVLTNPTHFAVALRYKQGSDPAPIVLARGRGVTAEAIRELAAEQNVPLLSYPELTRAIYYTTRAGQFVREDLYLAVATVLAFVFNLDAARAAGHSQPPVEVPPEARFDAEGRRIR